MYVLRVVYGWCVVAVGVCELRGCDVPLPEGRRKFCSDGHRKIAQMRRYRAKKRGERALEDELKPVNGPGRVEVAADGRVSARRPPPTFVDDGWFGWLAEGVMSHAEVGVWWAGGDCSGVEVAGEEAWGEGAGG